MLLILGVLAVVLAVSGWLSHRGVPRYGVRISGSLPLTQKVGTAVIASATIRNTGPAIPDLDVDVGGCTDHWVLGHVNIEGGSLPLGRPFGAAMERGGWMQPSFDPEPVPGCRSFAHDESRRPGWGEPSLCCHKKSVT